MTASAGPSKSMAFASLPVSASRVVGAALGSRAIRALRGRRWLALVLLACVAVALVAALLPVRGSDGTSAAGPGGRLPAGVALPAAPDLAPFLTNRRWGVSVLEERRKRQAQEEEHQAEASEPQPTTPLQAIGFVGVAVNARESAVLLALPEGEVVRRVAGEALADGRVLVAVRGDALVLERENGERETLLLFPAAPAP